MLIGNAAYFLEEYPVLLDEDLVFHKAPAYRHRLVTVPSGKVRTFPLPSPAEPELKLRSIFQVTIQVNVMTRNFGAYGVDPGMP